MSWSRDCKHFFCFSPRAESKLSKRSGETTHRARASKTIETPIPLPCRWRSCTRFYAENQNFCLEKKKATRMSVLCNVAGCRYASTHLTCAHRCGTCGAYGHGQMECGDARKVTRLASLPSVASIATPCGVPACTYPWSHTSDAHHCAACGFRGPGCTCRRARSSILTKQCPLCKQTSAVDTAHGIFTGADCVVCLESGPVVIFSGCRHAAVCARCIPQLTDA